MTVDNDIPNFCEGLAGQRPLMRRCPAFPRITTGNSVLQWDSHTGVRSMRIAGIVTGRRKQ